MHTAERTRDVQAQAQFYLLTNGEPVMATLLEVLHGLSFKNMKKHLKEKSMWFRKQKTSCK